MDRDTIAALRDLMQVYEFQEFFLQGARLALHVAGADGAALIEQTGMDLEYRFFSGLPQRYQELTHLRFPRDQGIAGAALHTEQVVYTPDYAHSPYAMASYVEIGLRGSLAIPLKGADGFLGVLALSWLDTPPPKSPTNEQWETILLIGDLLAAYLYRSKLEDHLTHMATRDNLTGLPNRSVLKDRLTAACARADRHESLLAVIFVDLDGFKPVNDCLGHAIGDQLIQNVAAALLRSVRRGDTVVRYAGDEFVLILEDIAHVGELERVAQRVLSALLQTAERDDISVPIAASLGATLYPIDDVEPEMLICHADLAMYAAKQLGGNQWQLYNNQSTHQLQNRQTLLDELEGALDRDEFVLFWQPIVDLPGKTISGVEALLRWNHPVHGVLPPADFLDILESSPFMARVGHWVLHEGVRQGARWHRAGRLLDIHINLAAMQVEDLGLQNSLHSLLAEHPDFHPEHLWFEIMERVAIRDIPTTAALIRTCRVMGVHFALDDFGTGAAALQYLLDLDCDAIKLDKSFVAPMDISEKHHRTVRAMVDMARALSVKVVAEGVETENIADLLNDLHVSHAQGYLYAYPMEAETINREHPAPTTSPEPGIER